MREIYFKTLFVFKLFGTLYARHCGMEKSRFILKRNVYVSLRDCHKFVSLKSIHTKYIFLIAQEILLLCFGLLKKSSQEEVS